MLPLDSRLSAVDLAILASYLFGPRWQSATARKLDCDARLMRAWKSGQRPVSARLSRDLVTIVVIAAPSGFIASRIAMRRGWLTSGRNIVPSLIQSAVRRCGHCCWRCDFPTYAGRARSRRSGARCGGNWRAEPCRDHEFGDHGMLRRAALPLFGILSHLIENRRDLLATGHEPAPLADRMNCRDHRLPFHFATNPAEILPQLCGAFPDESTLVGMLGS
jgi:hypothetical protein